MIQVCHLSIFDLSIYLLLLCSAMMGKEREKKKKEKKPDDNNTQSCRKQSFRSDYFIFYHYFSLEIGN